MAGDAPNLNITQPVILLDHIQGVSLDYFELEQVDVDFLASECLQITEAYGKMGVKKPDVRLGKFIVKYDGPGVVLIDFAASELRGDNTSDSELQERKRGFDEDGEFRYKARYRWGPTFKPNGSTVQQLHQDLLNATSKHGRYLRNPVYITYILCACCYLSDFCLSSIVLFSHACAPSVLLLGDG
ncbi:hypothetical protein OPQ81_003401 [Rhizoctonia solani]|nr:hypothetical protein OPQ81_003401 [Rhizoctonia solani]